jgi:transcriptional regulator with XRE-family HTH domain
MKTIKVQVSENGLEGVPVNPYSIDPNKNYPLMGEDNILRAIEAFAASHPSLPLTTPQTPNAIIEVLEEPVWQKSQKYTQKWHEAEPQDYTTYNNFRNFTGWVEERGYITRKAYQVVITPVPNSEPKEDFAIKKQKDGVFYSIIGGNIIKGRNNKNITQEQLGSRLGISRVSVGNIESGKQRLPVHLMHQVANALNIDLMDLFNGLDRKFSKNTISKQTINSVKRQTSHDKALEILRHKFDETEYETVLPVSTDAELLEGYKSEYEAMIEIANWQAQQQPVSKREEQLIITNRISELKTERDECNHSVVKSRIQYAIEELTDILKLLK